MKSLLSLGRLFAAALCAAGMTAVLAQSSGGDFEISGSTLDAGGGASNAPDFEMVGTIAQFDANEVQSSGGEYVLAGGMWARASDRLFGNGFEEL